MRSCLVLGFAGAACASEPVLPCIDQPFADASWTCRGARRFAARDLQYRLYPTDEEIARYEERLERVALAEPLAVRFLPFRERVPSTEIPVWVGDPEVLRQWSYGGRITHNVELDRTMDELGVTAIEADGFERFVLRVSRDCFAEEVLATRLSALRIELPPRISDERQAQTSWTWTAGEWAELHVTMRWGTDEEAGTRQLRAVIPPEGEVHVYDRGGDPLPPDLQLAPTTYPDPTR